MKIEIEDLTIAVPKLTPFEALARMSTDIATLVPVWKASGIDPAQLIVCLAAIGQRVARNAGVDFERFIESARKMWDDKESA